MLKVFILTTLNSEFAYYLIRGLIHKKVRIVGVIVDGKETEKGQAINRQRYPQSHIYYSTKEIARISDAGDTLPHFFVANHNSDSCINLIDELEVDYVLNGGTPRILKKNFIVNIGKKILNSHPALLPNYKGCSSFEWSLLNEDICGSSVHLIDESIDGGQLLHFKAMEVDFNKSYKEARQNILLNSALALADVVVGNDEYANFTEAYKTSTRTDQYYKPIPDQNLAVVISTFDN